MLYLDYAASTPLHPEVLEKMMPYLTENYGNPSGVHAQSRFAKNAIESAREGIANFLGASPDEIFFTSGGTEAANWAVFGIADATPREDSHFVTSKIEHHGVLNAFAKLDKEGFDVSFLSPCKEGYINASDLQKAIKPNTRLVSIMLANNEVGTIQPIKELTRTAAKHNTCFHTDAVQAIGHIPVDVNELGVDLLSFSAHKFYGPKGIGGLYIKKGTKIHSQLYGGSQERNRRAGTENVAGIVGMHEALKICASNMEIEKTKLENLRDKLIHEILTNIPHSRLNGTIGHKRLPGNVHISFDFIEGESLLMHLDLQGICASTGSACSSGSLEPSHMLMAMGLTHEEANGAIRFSLGMFSTEDDIKQLMPVLITSVERLRNLSPLYDDYIIRRKGEQNGL